MRRQAWWMLLLSGCSARGLTGEDVCRDAVVALSARLVECTGDEDAALDLPDDIDDDVECRLDGMDSEELEPDIERYYDCVEGLLALDCAVAEAAADDPAAFFGPTNGCATVLLAEDQIPDDTGSAGDTGVTR